MLGSLEARAQVDCCPANSRCAKAPPKTRQVQLEYDILVPWHQARANEYFVHDAYVFPAKPDLFIILPNRQECHSSRKHSCATATRSLSSNDDDILRQNRRWRPVNLRDRRRIDHETHRAGNTTTRNDDRAQRDRDDRPQTRAKAGTRGGRKRCLWMRWRS